MYLTYLDLDIIGVFPLHFPVTLSKCLVWEGARSSLILVDTLTHRCLTYLQVFGTWL